MTLAETMIAVAIVALLVVVWKVLRVEIASTRRGLVPQTPPKKAFRLLGHASQAESASNGGAGIPELGPRAWTICLLPTVTTGRLEPQHPRLDPTRWATRPDAR
jgi:hypothetical protein